MLHRIKVKDVDDFFNVYPSIEMKKNRIIVRVCRRKIVLQFTRGLTFLEAGYVYAPYIPLINPPATNEAYVRRNRDNKYGDVKINKQTVGFIL